MACTSLESLAFNINHSVAKVSQLLRQSNLPQPTFDESGAVDVSTKQSEPREVIEARNELINYANDLLMLARGPVDHVVSLGYASVDTAATETLTRFKIPNHIPLGSTATIKQLSVSTGLPENELSRTVRYATTKGVFTERAPGVFGHTAASATLAKNKGLSDMTLFNAGFSTRLVVCIADQLWAKHGLKKIDHPEAPFNEAFHGYENMFDYMAKSAVQSQEYYNYLDGRASLPRYQVGHVPNIWDWNRVASGTIIDVS